MCLISLSNLSEKPVTFGGGGSFRLELNINDFRLMYCFALFVTFLFLSLPQKMELLLFFFKGLT